MNFNPFPYGDPRYFQHEQLEELRRLNNNDASSSLVNAAEEAAFASDRTANAVNDDLQFKKLMTLTPEQRVQWAFDRFAPIYQLNDKQFRKLDPIAQKYYLKGKDLLETDPWAYYASNAQQRLAYEEQMENVRIRNEKEQKKSWLWRFLTKPR